MTNVTVSRPTCRKSAQEESRTRQQQCVSFSSNMASTTTVRDIDLNNHADELSTE